MADPYARNMFGSFNPYFAKRAVEGNFVVVLDGTFEDRGLSLIKPSSRVLTTGAIHELIVTDGQAKPGAEVNRIAYLGFFEVTQGGVIVVGDEVRIGSKVVGSIAGFDETHMPNHLNIVLTGKRIAGKTHGIVLNEVLTIG